MSTKTKTGALVVFHVNSCPFARVGSPISGDYIREGCAENPWFFIPADGNPTALGNMRGYPMIYSPGYKTEAEALEAAEAWELRKPEADAANAAAQRQLASFIGTIDMNEGES